MSFKGTRARGGKRVGAGRKPTAYTVLKREIEAHGRGEAEYAFSLLSAIMRNEAADVKIRMAAADMVLDRVLGKPKQHVSGDPTAPLAIVIEYATNNGQSAGPPSGPATDQS